MQIILMKMKLCSVVLLVIQIVRTKGQITLDQYEDQMRNCSTADSEIRVTFPRWPFQLDCKGMMNNVDPNQCYVQYNDSTLQLANTRQFQLNSSETFAVYLITNNRCIRKNITIDIRSLFNGSVFDTINNIYLENKTIEYRSLLTGQKLQFDCFPPSLGGTSKTSHFSLALPPDGEYNATWWRTQRYPNGSLSSQKIFERGIPQFKNYSNYITQHPNAEIISVANSPQSILRYVGNYFDPGLYSCELEYNGQTAFVTHQSLCVGNVVEDKSPPVVMCTQHHVFDSGENMIIKCSAFSSNVMIDSGEMSVEWRRESTNSQPICTYDYEMDNTPSPSSDRYSCSVTGFKNFPGVCYDYVPENEEIRQHPDRKDFSVVLNIKDMQKSDDGKYYIRVKYRNRVSEDALFQLDFNTQDELRKVVIILVSILAVLIIISVAVMVVWCYWIQIQLFIRRHMGKYDQDDKEFVAILSYVYSNDLPEVTKERTRKIVHCVQEKMKDMNYSFYDSHRYFDQGSTVENLLKYLNESHRMIVILTEAYVDERWSRFEAQQGFLNMLKNRTKLIFIRTPGARKALRRCTQKGDDFSSELNEAMKASRNIRWTEKMSETRFKDHVQYALPNLNRDTSEQDDSGKFIRLQNYDRSDSNFTQISCLSLEDEKNDQYGIDDQVDVSFSKSNDVKV